MSNITLTNGTPMDVNDQLRSAMDLNPDNPNDMAFTLVTILYFFVYHKNSLFSFRTAHTHTHVISHSCVVSHCATSPPVLASLA
jgi:hypothetical protein